MSEEAQSSSGLSPAAQAANEAFFSLVRRELGSAGKEDAIPYLTEIMKLRLEKEDKVADASKLEFTLSQMLTEYELQLNATTGEVVSWYLDFLAEDGTDETPPEVATKIAEGVAQPPADAKMTAAEYDSTSGRTIFRARWNHFVDGIPVEGDFIEVLVNGAAKRAFSYSRNWRTPDLSGRPREL